MFKFILLSLIALNISAQTIGDTRQRCIELIELNPVLRTIQQTDDFISLRCYGVYNTAIMFDSDTVSQVVHEYSDSLKVRVMNQLINRCDSINGNFYYYDNIEVEVQEFNGFMLHVVNRHD